MTQFLPSHPPLTAEHLHEALIGYVSSPADEDHRNPFVVTIDSRSALAGRNYAVPRAGHTPTLDDVRALIKQMDEAHRVARLEYAAPRPDLDEVLEMAEFTVDTSLRLMVLGSSGIAETALAATAGRYTVRAASESDLLAVVRVQGEAYGDDADPVENAGRLRGTIESGGAVSVALDAISEQVVGAGLATPPAPTSAGPLSEVAVVAVDAAHRRRGLGSALGAHLSYAVHSVGARPFLQVESQVEQRVYERVGYVVIGEFHVATR